MEASQNGLKSFSLSMNNYKDNDLFGLINTTHLLMILIYNLFSILKYQTVLLSKDEKMNINYNDGFILKISLDYVPQYNLGNEQDLEKMRRTLNTLWIEMDKIFDCLLKIFKGNDVMFGFKLKIYMFCDDDERVGKIMIILIHIHVLFLIHFIQMY